MSLFVAGAACGENLGDRRRAKCIFSMLRWEKHALQIGGCEDVFMVKSCWDHGRILGRRNDDVGVSLFVASITCRGRRNIW